MMSFFFFENFEIFKNESTETGNDRNVGAASLYRLIASVVAAIHSLARADRKCVADMMTCWSRGDIISNIFPEFRMKVRYVYIM